MGLVIGTQGRRHNCERQGLPYSNLVLIDQRMKDLGEEATLRLFVEAIDSTPWRQTTHDAVLAKFEA